MIAVDKECMQLKMITNKRDARHSLIAIKPLPIETVTKSGFLVDFIPGGQRLRGDQPSKGQIIAVPDIFRSSIVEGDYVLYTDLNGGYEADLDGQQIFFTRPENILAYIEKPEAVEVPIYGVSG